MSLTVADLLVRLRADTTQFKSKMANASKSMKRIGASMSEVGSKATSSITVPLLGIGIAAGKMSADFEMSIAKMKGLVGVADEDLTLFKDAIKKVGKETGKTGTELANAAFFITSAGLKGARAAEGVEALRAAAQGATAGLGDTATVADAATSAMNAYGAGAMTATRAVSILVATVREGKADAASIAPVLGRLLPIAAELEVSFDQVGGALAAMTRLGFDAATSATSIRATMVAMLKPSVQAKKALAEYGLSFGDLRAELKEKGLLSVLQTLKNTFGENEEAMAQVVPNVRALAGVLALVGKNGEASEKIFASLANTTERDLATALEAVTDTSAHGLIQAFTDIKGSLRELGDVILPALVPAFRGLADVVGSVGGAFSILPDSVKMTGLAFLGVAAALGPLTYLAGNFISIFAFMVPKLSVAAGAIKAFGPVLVGFGKYLALAWAKIMMFKVSLASLKVLLLNPIGFLGASAAVASFGAAVTLLISYKLTDWLMKNTKWGKALSESLTKLGSDAINFYDSMANGKKDFENQIGLYQKLARKLELTGEKWRISADYTAANRDRLKELMKAATAYAVEQNKVNVANTQALKTEKAQVGLSQQRINQIKAKAAANKEFVNTLKDEYELFSADDIRQNMDTMVKHFEAAKAAGIDMKQLGGAFSDDLLNWVDLAKENKIELPLGVRKMAEEMKKSGTPAMNKLLDAVSEDFPQHVNAMPGKLLPAFKQISEDVGGALEGGFETGFKHGAMKSDIMRAALKTQVETGIDEGITLGEELLAGLRTRQEAEAMTVKVIGDWSDFDEQARYRSTGFVPEPGQP